MSEQALHVTRAYDTIANKDANIEFPSEFITPKFPNYSNMNK
jgi:hypothetical protein